MQSQRTLRIAERPAGRVARLVDPAPAAEPETEGWEKRAKTRPADPDLTRRLLRGRENGARAGKHQSGTAPYGYYRDYEARARGEKGVPLKLHPVEAEVIRTIFRLYLELRSMKRVVETLNAAGCRTRRGKEWSRAGIAWILKNETYVGRVHFGSIRSKGHHEPIIEIGKFQRIQRLIRKNDKRGRGEERRVAAAAGV
jgi:hypothetical protein